MDEAPSQDAPTVATARAHRRVPMRGRDPHEPHRAATPLELLFDLTLVVAFSAASDELAHLLAEGLVGGAVLGFAVAIFATVWPWVNYSWFASAYDTDDWVVRLLTMVQMFGVLLAALGMPQFFESIANRESPDNTVVIVGYVVMRLAMVVLWLRAAAEDPVHRRACRTYALLISVVQVAWVVSAFVDLSFVTGLVFALCAVAAEMLVPVVAERQGPMTPWHAHHIVERYGLLVIIALGEVVLGTTASISAVVQEQGWTAEAATVGFAGVALVFGMWWVYFTLPFAEVLHVRRRRSFAFGYGHILVYGSIAALGAGLHVAAYTVEGESELSGTGAVLAVVVPVLIYTVLVFGIYGAVVRHVDGLHVVLLSATLVVLLVAVVLAASGAPLAVTLAVVAAAPWVTVVGYETVGHRHVAAELGRLGA
ncbi:low temperature requirement protein LtrA [Sediminihabitans luteus]|uniref:Low temperature requirement protein LtrA n=1 Tax=Sediminihabitans luteus TaxID=1138585 RepID=A0A2M9D198_9CELL|nr:low temperature requirement protein A [Sediminihabitans luteus]PJJ77853.1 low temperature requirement protein LtrA [Sediminihabitans luteus]GII99789.1 membrane protein [Sediminihabitans luteus]